MYRYIVGNPGAGKLEGRDVITIIDLKTELGKLNMLRGRRPETTEAERKASGGFATLAPFRDGNIFSAKFSGDGSTTLHIMTQDGPQSHALSAGMVVIVPQGAWHRFHSPDGVSLVTATPKPTEHLTVDVDDPRTLTTAQLSGNIEEKWR